MRQLRPPNFPQSKLYSHVIYSSRQVYFKAQVELLAILFCKGNILILQEKYLYALSIPAVNFKTNSKY